MTAICSISVQTLEHKTNVFDWTYLTPLEVMLLTELFSWDRTELWLLRMLGVENSLRMY